MSVEALKTSSTGFLREFHFSTLTQAVINDLLGEVKSPTWMKFTATHVQDPLARQIVFTVTVELHAHSHLVDLWDRQIRVGLKNDRRFVMQFNVSERVLMEFRGQLPTMFATWLEKTLRQDAYKLYEVDPRIGWQSKHMNHQLPVSELFDPPEPFSRTGTPVWAKEKVGEEARYVEYQCPFCPDPHKEGNPPVWAGANLMWVHPQCWRTPS